MAQFGHPRRQYRRRRPCRRSTVSPAIARVAAIVAIAVSVATGVMGTPSQAWAAGAFSSSDGPAAPKQRPWPWPCQLIAIGELRAVVDTAWRHSATFRDQCRKLAAAGAVMVIEPVTSRQTLRARTRIGRTEAGVASAHAYVRPADNTLELIAHELEHVLEYVDGVKFLLEAGTGGSGVSLRGGAYETRRAVAAGRRVAKEVRERGVRVPAP